MTMTDSRAAEVLAAMRDEGSCVDDADWTAAIDRAIAALSQQPEARGVVDGWTLASDSQPEPGAKINFAAIVSHGFLGSGDYPYVDALTGRCHMAKNVLAWRPALTGERNG